MTEPFQDFVFSGGLSVVEARKRSVLLDSSEGVLLLKGRSLSQLLQLLGISVYDYRKNPEVLAERLSSFDRPLVFSAVKSYIEGIDYYVYRITTEKYTPIPHRVLFDFVESLLKEMNVDYFRRKFVKYYRRTAMMWFIDRREIWDRKDYVWAALLVSNANTARDAIHVTGLVQVTSCKNSIAVIDYAVAAHVGTREAILLRVKKGVEKVLKQLRKEFPALKRRLDKMKEIELSESIVKNWIRTWLEKMPRKYYRWFERTVRDYVKDYGYTTAALWQTATYFATRLQDRNIELARAFERQARKMLEEVG